VSQRVARGDGGGAAGRGHGRGRRQRADRGRRHGRLVPRGTSTRSARRWPSSRATPVAASPGVRPGACARKSASTSREWSPTTAGCCVPEARLRGGGPRRVQLLAAPRAPLLEGRQIALEHRGPELALVQRGARAVECSARTVSSRTESDSASARSRSRSRTEADDTAASTTRCDHVSGRPSPPLRASSALSSTTLQRSATPA